MPDESPIFRLRGVSFAFPGEPPIIYTFNHEDQTMTTEPTPEAHADRLLALQLAIGYSTSSYLDSDAIVGTADRFRRYLESGSIDPKPEDKPEETAEDRPTAWRNAAQSRFFATEPPPAPTVEDPSLADRARMYDWTIVHAAPNPVYQRAFELALEAAELRANPAASMAGASLPQLLADAKTIAHFLKSGETAIPTESAKAPIHRPEDIQRQMAGTGGVPFDQMERLRGQFDPTSTARQAAAAAQDAAEAYRRGINGGGIAKDARPAEPRDEFTGALDSIGRAMSLVGDIAGAIGQAAKKGTGR